MRIRIADTTTEYVACHPDYPARTYSKQKYSVEQAAHAYYIDATGEAPPSNPKISYGISCWDFEFNRPVKLKLGQQFSSHSYAEARKLALDNGGQEHLDRMGWSLRDAGAFEIWGGKEWKRISSIYCIVEVYDPVLGALEEQIAKLERRQTDARVEFGKITRQINNRETDLASLYRRRAERVTENATGKSTVSNLRLGNSTGSISVRFGDSQGGGSFGLADAAIRRYYHWLGQEYADKGRD